MEPLGCSEDPFCRLQQKGAHSSGDLDGIRWICPELRLPRVAIVSWFNHGRRNLSSKYRSRGTNVEAKVMKFIISDLGSADSEIIHLN